MKGVLMNNKRIIAGVVALSLVAGNVGSYGTVFNDHSTISITASAAELK